MAHPDRRHISFTHPPVASMCVVTLHNLFCTQTTPTLSLSFLLAQAIFEPNLFPYKYPNISQPSHSTPTCLWRWNRQSDLKRRHIKFRRRGITQKEAYNKIHVKPAIFIQNDLQKKLLWGTSIQLTYRHLDYMLCSTREAMHVCLQ